MTSSDVPDPQPGTCQRFWINTVSLDHVRAAAAGGFTQADHGAGTRLRRPRPGDEMIFYSPRASLHGPGAAQAVRQFTAWATITGQAPYQALVSDTFKPWRLAATFHPWSAFDAKAVLEQLSFTPDPAHWGLPFRRGLFTIPSIDFDVISSCGRLSVEPGESGAEPPAR